MLMSWSSGTGRMILADILPRNLKDFTNNDRVWQGLVWSSAGFGRNSPAVACPWKNPSGFHRVTEIRIDKAILATGNPLFHPFFSIFFSKHDGWWVSSRCEELLFTKNTLSQTMSEIMAKAESEARDFVEEKVSTSAQRWSWCRLMKKKHANHVGKKNE